MTMIMDMQQHIALAEHRVEYEYAEILKEGLSEPPLFDLADVVASEQRAAEIKRDLLGEPLPLLEGAHSPNSQ